MAAQYLGQTRPTARIEDMIGVSFTAFTDKNGMALPQHNCSGSYFADPGNGQMFFDTLTVRVAPHAVCKLGDCPAIRDYGMLEGYPRCHRTFAASSSSTHTSCTCGSSRCCCGDPS